MLKELSPGLLKLEMRQFPDSFLSEKTPLPVRITGVVCTGTQKVKHFGLFATEMTMGKVKFAVIDWKIIFGI